MKFKRTLATLLSTGALLTALSATHTVSELGGDFTSIGAAITAAAKGDTLLIDEKTGAWSENITIDKGLTLLNNNAEMFYVVGDMSVTTIDTVHIDDMNLDGKLSYTSNSASGLLQLTNCITNDSITAVDVTTRGSKLRIIGCNVVSIKASGLASNTTNYYTLEAYNNIISSEVVMAEGDLIGNSLTNGMITVNGRYKQNVKILGNNIVRKDTTIIKIYGDSTTALISNNVFNFNQINADYNFGTKGVAISGHVFGEISIYNNRFQKIGDGASVCRNHSSSENTILNFGNNLMQNSGSGSTAPTYCIYSYSQPIVNYFYNVSGGFTSSSTNIDKSSNNTIDSVVVDMGDPSPIYNDLDGTRNDVGEEGGAYPYSSYARSGWIAASERKPFVPYIEAPRRIRVNQSISIKATGVAH